MCWNLCYWVTLPSTPLDKEPHQHFDHRQTSCVCTNEPRLAARKSHGPSCRSAARPPSWFVLTQNGPCLLLPPHQNDLLCALWCEREAHLWQRDNRRMQIPGISCGRWLQIEMRSEEEDQLPVDRAQQVKQMHILLCAVKKKKKNKTKQNVEQHFMFTAWQDRTGNKKRCVAPLTSVG